MGLPCPVDTAIAEHMLDAVSTPASLQQLLAARGKGQAPDDDSAAAAAADGLLPVPLAGRYADNGGLGGSGSTAKLGSGSEDGGETGEAGGASPAPSVAASSSRGAAEQGQPRRPRRQRRSLSRELAVVFWRTLVDILRNPSLLLLHWWGAAPPACDQCRAARRGRPPAVALVSLWALPTRPHAQPATRMQTQSHAHTRNLT